MSPNELDLKSTLQQDAQRIDAIGDFATAAIGLERRRARRRTTVGAVAAAATLAIAAPQVWSNLGNDVRPVPATSTTVVEPSPSPTGSATPGPTVTQTTDPQPSATNAPPSAVPENTHVYRDTIVSGDKTIKLEKGTVVSGFAVLDNGGFVLQSRIGDVEEIEILSPEGKTVKRVSGAGGSFSTTRDGSKVLAQAGPEGSPAVILSSDGTVIQQREGSERAVSIVGDFVYFGSSVADGGLEWNYVTNQTRELPSHITAVSDDRTRAALQWFEPAVDGMDSVCWSVIDLTKDGFPTLVEQCGAQENQTRFMPGSFSANGTYLVGSKEIGGGYWFIPGVFRVSDGKDMLGDNRKLLGWTWRMDSDEKAIVISRNTSSPDPTPVTSNTLQRCTLAMECTDLAPERPMTSDIPTDPAYVVPR